MHLLQHSVLPSCMKIAHTMTTMLSGCMRRARRGVMCTWYEYKGRCATLSNRLTIHILQAQVKEQGSSFSFTKCSSIVIILYFT